jgi:hypothetical protein
MAPLIVIIIFHIIILLRAQSTKDKTIPYSSVFFFTFLLVVFVAYFLITMEKPE